MKNTQIKGWITVFLITLIAASGFASYLVQDKKLYKGLEELERKPAKVARASAVSYEESSLATFQSKESQENQKNTPEQEERKLVPKSPVYFIQKEPPCKANEIPVLKNAKVVRCDIPEKAPPPTVKIILDSCESKGKITYRGEDKPGLLYGMCM